MTSFIILNLNKLKKNKRKWEFPQILRPELENLNGRLERAVKLVKENRDNIHPSISYIDAIQLYDMYIDATQINPESTPNFFK